MALKLVVKIALFQKAGVTPVVWWMYIGHLVVRLFIGLLFYKKRSSRENVHFKVATGFKA